MRKTAYKHDVGSYTRNDGKRVEKYKRGKGSKPKQSKARSRNSKQSGYGYKVTLILSKASESYPVSGGSFSEASKAGLNHLVAGEVPRKVRVKLN